MKNPDSNIDPANKSTNNPTSNLPGFEEEPYTIFYAYPGFKEPIKIYKFVIDIPPVNKDDINIYLPKIECSGDTNEGNDF